MPSLSTLFKFSLTLLAAARVQGTPTPQEGAPAVVAPATTQATNTATPQGQAATAEAGLAAAIVTLHHDAVVSISQITPTGLNGTLYLTYQPRLKVVNGCVPFPAVDQLGQIGGGLKPTGGTEKGCDRSPGQVYARSALVGNKFAIMYTWYFPKDEPSQGEGTRHDWEGVVVYLKNAAFKNSTAIDSANIFAVCPSARGAWTCSTDFNLDGTFPLIEYVSRHNHGHTCYLSQDVGGQQALVAWESMPGPAASTLAKADFGMNVPFVDAHFKATLALAVPPA